MKVIARYNGPLGDIQIWENERDGSRMYLEGDIFQSHSTQTGESQFRYVKMMEHFLAPQADILTLGCGGGNLATMLARSGKSVIVVDHNAASIDIARQFFGMPQDIPCIVEDFRTFLASCNRQFGGIAIDVGGPGFCFEEQFDEETCRHIVRALAPGGRAIMNMLVGNDLDGATDVIASLLSGEDRTGWVFDQPGFTNRNALIAYLPQSRKEVDRRRIAELCGADASWVPRRPHMRRRRNSIKIEINCPAYATK